MATREASRRSLRDVESDDPDEPHRNVLVSKGAVPLLKKAGWGRIITISSQAGRMFTGFSSVHYASSKAGQIGLSRVLPGELGPFNITVNCVSPTRISGEMASSFGEAEKIDA